MKSRILRFIVLLLLVIPAASTSLGQGAPSRENQVKAAFIYNFAQFVEWPDDAFLGNGAPFVVGVLGDGALHATLEQALKGKTAGGREFAVRYFARTADITRCHILFVGASEQGRAAEVIQKVSHQGTLTVGDFDGFTAAAGVVRFMTEDNKLRFEVNVDAANDERLRVSSKLLKLARIYNKR
jgi:hypothetical protein